MTRPACTESRRLSDGTVVTGQPDHVRRAVLIDGQMQSEKEQWIAELRAAGIKAAHPDDGWVDRERDRVHLSYPQFNDGLKPGDRLALGAPAHFSGRPLMGETRIVRVLRWEPWRLGVRPDHGYWYFENA